MIRKIPDVPERMKVSLALVFAGVAVVSRLVAAAPETPAAQVERQPGRDVETLVRELGDENFRVREKATLEIWGLGDAALPALREAAGSSDPEQVFRAKDLLRKIQLHITPDTDAGVIALVERYQKASLSEKSALLGKMKGKRAWRQMLKLYASETSPELREKLRPSLNGVAVRAARECLLQGDAKGAREFLEMAPVDSESLLALAEYHRSQGTLDAELNRAKSVPGAKSMEWQLALQRAAGNLEAARDAAKGAGEERISAAMSAMLGDPLPWLRERPQDPEEDRSATAYARCAARLWTGQELRPADLEPLMRELSSRDASQRGAAMNALFLLGEAAPAEAAFAKLEPLAAFRHFEALERIPEALKALGFDPARPDYKAWVETHLAKLSANDIENQHEVSTDGEQLVALANFLERRGLREEAFAAYSGPLTDLAGKDANAFVDFLGKLFGNSETLSGAPRLARRIGAAWAGDDAKRWDQIVTAAFGDDEQSAAWWDWLAELDPKADRAERLDGMLALYGLGPDPSALRKRWLDLAWKAVEAAPAVERAKLAGHIATLSNQTGDVANSLKAWELLSESERAEVFWGQHIVHLSAQGKWADAAAVILNQISLVADPRQEGGADLHAYAAAALRQAGRGEEAATHDAWAEKLALGSPSIAIRIGNGYAYGNDYARAEEWWARAARESAPDSAEFALALKLHSDVLLEQGKWRETAAISEVLARIYASSDYRWTNPLPFMRQRLEADMARALSILRSNRSAALAILDNCHHAFASDGSLADFFFPALRKVGLMKEHDEWFRDSWDRMMEIIKLYPDSDNTRNTAAWFAARSLRNLGEAEKQLTIAMAANPNQPAYLDTMAEIQFAKGNREKALEWSGRAVNFAPDDPQIRRQHERFRSDPLPK